MDKFVDIEKIIASKAGKKAKFVPRCLIRWLKKIIHEDELNDYFWESRNLMGKIWLVDGMRYLDLSINVEGEDNLPTDNDGKQYIFVSNHPLGGPDGVALGYLLTQHYDNKVRILVNDFLMYIPGFAPLCIPVNKVGAQSRDIKRLIDEAYESENHTMIFPAGLCSRKQPDGSIKDVEWSKSFIKKSVQYQRDVVPIFFDGRNSEKFYNIALWCKRLKLKFNFAMLFLVDEMYRNRHKTYNIKIGKPIPWQTFDESKSPNEWAQHVRDKVYELGNR